MPAVTVAKAADTPPGTITVHEVNGTRIALCNVNGRFYAIDDVCTHDGGPLDQGELIDNLVRPVSLALRLFGNMTGDHLVLEIFTGLTKLVVPVLFYMLGAFVSLIQAFVFTLLTIIYVSLAIGHGHEAEHGHH